MISIFSTAVHNNLERKVDKSGKVSVLVFLDLSSAFDTVNHKILLTVLEQRFDVTGLALDWYRSYLSDRTQTFGSDSSIAFVVDSSVPQGSVLGPLKIVAYTDDLPAVVEQHHVDHDLYADDAQLSDHQSIVCVSDAFANIENCITNINKRCASKRLQGRRLEGLDLGLHVGADIIRPVDVVRDLGVFLDTNLTMKKHISKITSVSFYHLRRLKSDGYSVQILQLAWFLHYT